MKLRVIIMVSAVLLFLAGEASSIGLGDNNGVNANPHNLSSSATHAGPKAKLAALGGTTEICIFCHTPHGADPQGPLWNRKDITAVESFPIYNSSTLQIKNIPEAQYNSTNPDYPNGSSRLCLSCHDGSTAVGYGIGDVINGPNELLGAPIAMEVADNLGGRSSQIDLTQSHPISFVYKDGANKVVDGINNYKQIQFPPNTYTLPLNSDVVVLDSQGRMQCTTCHDPHDDASEFSADGVPPFWRNSTLTFPDKIQAVCNDCHNGDPDGIRPDPNHGPTFPL